MIKVSIFNDICDKTWQEIYDAFSRHENVIISHKNGDSHLITSVYKTYDPSFYLIDNDLVAQSPNDYPHFPGTE